VCYSSRIAARGRWGTIEWAWDLGGRLPAREVYESLEPRDRARIDSLFKMHAENGPLRNALMFRSLGDSGGKQFSHLWEFKANQWRFLGDFRGRRFIVSHGVRKKQDRHRKSDLARAVKILEENDRVESKNRGNGKAGTK
jgi:hypothetical protein